MYLFYLGLRQLFGRTSALGAEAHLTSQTGAPTARRLYQEALLTAATNPKPILFFTALFPQFIDAHAPLAAQFLILTGIFGALSFVSLISYALVASRARSLLSRPRLARWIDRCFGAIFIAFGAALLTLRRQAN
jgi:threonine/homoserine/homoserine lactone efflux protein